MTLLLAAVWKRDTVFEIRDAGLGFDMRYLKSEMRELRLRRLSVGINRDICLWMI